MIPFLSRFLLFLKQSETINFTRSCFFKFHIIILYIRMLNLTISELKSIAKERNMAIKMS